MISVVGILFKELLKNRSILGYTLALTFLGWGTFSLEAFPEKAILTLVQVTLIILPLLTSIFSAIYYYNSKEFILLLLAQPINRRQLILSLYTVLISVFNAALIIGLGIPTFFYAGFEAPGLYLILTGFLLNAVFTAFSLMLVVRIRDKSRGIGAVLILWIAFAFLFDGGLLYLMYSFADYPIESVILVLSLFNPIDIGRFLVLIHTDSSALLGLSGSIFSNFFGSVKGILISLFSLIGWSSFGLFFLLRSFSQKDF